MSLIYPIAIDVVRQLVRLVRNVENRISSLIIRVIVITAEIMVGIGIAKEKIIIRGGDAMTDEEIIEQLMGTTWYRVPNNLSGLDVYGPIQRCAADQTLVTYPNADGPFDPLVLQDGLDIKYGPVFDSKEKAERCLRRKCELKIKELQREIKRLTCTLNNLQGEKEMTTINEDSKLLSDELDAEIALNNRMRIDLAALTQKLKSSEQIRHAEKKILIEEVSKNTALRADNERLRAFAEAHEAWEAEKRSLVMNYHGELKELLWLLTDSDYKAFTSLQKLRNEALQRHKLEG